MKRSHWMNAAAALLVLAAVAPAGRTAPAPGDKSPLAQVPATAPVVIHINGLETVRDHVVAFLKNALPDQADLVQKQADDFLKNGFQGRKLKGLAKDGPIFVVLTEMPKPGDNPPKMAIIAAVTSYADFRDNILTDKEKKNLKQGDGFESTVSDMGGDVFFVDKKDYVVVTPRKDVAASFTKTAAAPGLDGKISKTQAAKLLSSDLGVYVSVDAFSKEYADQIKAARQAVEEQLKKAEETLGKAQKAQFEIAKKLIGPVFQALEDSQGALETVEVRPGGVALHTDVEVRAGTPTADLLKGSKTSAFKDLFKLPAGEVFYSGMEMTPALLKFGGAMITGLSSDPDAKGAKALAEAFDDWVKAGPTESLGAVSYPVTGVQAVQCADPQKAVAAQLKMLQAMGTEGGFQNVYFKEKPEVKEKAEKYKEIDFTSVHMVWDFDKTMAAAGAAGGKELPDKVKKQMGEAMKQMVGENLNMWLGTDGKSMVTVMAKDWDAAQKLLDQYYKGDGSVGDDKAFAAARKELPSETSFLIMIDAVQYVGVMLDFIKPIIEASGAPVPAKFPKAVKDKPGFVGVAVTLDPDRGSFDLFVSGEAVKQIYKGYVAPLMPRGGN